MDDFEKAIGKISFKVYEALDNPNIEGLQIKINKQTKKYEVSNFDLQVIDRTFYKKSSSNFKKVAKASLATAIYFLDSGKFTAVDLFIDLKRMRITLDVTHVSGEIKRIDVGNVSKKNH